MKAQSISMTCNFLFLCGGYYSYDKPYMPKFPEQDRFEGQVIHPQFWDESLDYSDKKVIVIGSGATAVTLVPAIAKNAAHVTMLQRSPSYVVSAPGEDSWSQALNKIFPIRLTYFLIRWKNIFRTSLGFYLSRKYPERVKDRLINLVREELGNDYDVEKHFTPRYNPWDQRMCLVPDSDLFNSIKSGKASVVTDHIDHFTENGILVKSGEHLEADIIVTATGIELNALNDIEVSVNNEKVEPHNRLSYKGMMLSGVPNLAFSFGYVNASWTLRADLTCEYVCRLLNRMDKLGVNTCIPQEDPTAIVDDEYIDFSSGYVQRALDRLPKQGKKAPWRNYQNYLKDIFLVRLFSLKDSTLKFYNSK
jgi:monooxygenase